MNKYPLSSFLSRSYNDVDGMTLFRVLPELPPLNMETGPWLAGGSVRRTILGEETKTSDFDFFFNSIEQKEQFVKSLLEKNGAKKVRSSPTAETYHIMIDDKTTITIQAITALYYTKAENVIDSFDFTICQFLTDGITLLVGEHSLWDLARKRLALHKVSYGASTIRRMIKYARQGLTACDGTIVSILNAIVSNPQLIHAEALYID